MMRTAIPGVLVALLALSAPAMAANYSFIDNDGDGYGVGSPLGMDADDNDKAVNTSASAIQKYGSVTNYLSAQGYGTGRVFYISPSGSNSGGQVNNISKPFADWGGINGKLQPGDTVVYRGGTYTGNYTLYADYTHGTAAAPINIVAYPGERVVLDAGAESISMTKSSYINFDGLVLANSKSDHLGYGIRMIESQNVTFKNMDISGHSMGIMGMQDLHNVALINSVVHDNPNSHGVYFGSRDLPNSNITVTGSLIYKNGYTGIQHNGRVENMVIENNIVHSNSLAGLSLIEGVSGASVKGNLVFNNNRQALVLYLYDSTDPSIQPFPMRDNVIEDNVFMVGRYSWQDNGTDYPALHAAVLFDNSTGNKSIPMDGNVFRDNIIMSYQGPLFWFNPGQWADDTVIEGNQMYRELGQGLVLRLDTGEYTWAEFVHFAELYGDNIWGMPEFANVSWQLADLHSLDFTLLGGNEDPPPVPEPATLALLLLGVPALGAKRWLTKRSHA